MPRPLLKRILPDRHSLARRWYLRPFRGALSNPAYWTLHRRSVIRAVTTGTVHLLRPFARSPLLAPTAAILLRANLPLSMLTILLVNPLTMVPVFFGAYWVGTVLTGSNLESFDFALTWDWASENLVSDLEAVPAWLSGERNPGRAVRLSRDVGVVAPACHASLPAPRWRG